MYTPVLLGNLQVKIRVRVRVRVRYCMIGHDRVYKPNPNSKPNPNPNPNLYPIAGNIMNEIKSDIEIFDTASPDGLSMGCLTVLEILLKADSTSCDLMVQYILAPPPPSMDDDGEGEGLEALR
jgi:hypothetical protein